MQHAPKTGRRFEPGHLWGSILKRRIAKLQIDKLIFANRDSLVPDQSRRSGFAHPLQRTERIGLLVQSMRTALAAVAGEHHHVVS